MSLNAATLGALIVTKIEAATGNEIPDIGHDVWEAVAEAIVQHFQTSAQVAVASVTGVTTGGGTSGPGTGTIL